jgi:O-antigen/teichoic acid export membrane protein
MFANFTLYSNVRIMGIILRDSFRITVIAYIGAAIGFLNKIFLFTNFLSPDQVGLANMLITISLVYAQFASLGTHNIVYKFFPYFKNQEKQHNGFLQGVLVLALAGFLIATIFFFLLKKPFASFYQESSPLLVEYYFYLVPMALATVFFQIFDSYLRSLFKNSIPSLIYEVGLRLFVTLSITVYAIKLVDFPTFVLIYVLANCLPAFFIVAYTGFIRQLFVKPVFTGLWSRLAKIIIVYGLFALLNNAGVWLLGIIDSLMVAGFIDLGAAGVYTTMVFITSVLLIPYRSIIKVSTPVVASFWQSKDMKAMAGLYRDVSNTSLAIGGGLFLLIWVNIDSVFQFMPADYALGKYVVLLLGIGRLFDMASGVNGVIMVTSKKYRYDLAFTLGLVVATFVSNYFLIPAFGINGAALATMITLLLYNLFRIIFIKVNFKIQPFALKQIWVPLVIALLSGFSLFFAQIQNVYVDLIVRSTIIGGIYLVAIYKLKISPELNGVISNYAKKLKG